MKPANYAPVYAAALYPGLAELCRQHGYALAVHGSLARDFDLIAVPWAEEVSDRVALLTEMTTKFAIRIVGDEELKTHGRVAFTLSVGFGECAVDLSFLPNKTDDVCARLRAHNRPADGSDSSGETR